MLPTIKILPPLNLPATPHIHKCQVHDFGHVAEVSAPFGNPIDFVDYVFGLNGFLGIEHAVNDHATDQAAHYLGVLSKQVPVPHVVEHKGDLVGLGVRIGQEPCVCQERVFKLEGLLLVHDVPMVQGFSKCFQLVLDFFLVFLSQS
jgi:hypothetical protein